MRPKRQARLCFLGVLLGSAGCDQASKHLVMAALGRSGSVWLANGALRLEVASNPGAFLSLGAGLPEALRTIVFLAIVPLLVLVLCIQLLRTHGRSMRVLVGLGFVAGGGLANWLDRILHGGAVTDFITLRLGPLHTGVFNVADVAVLAGIVLLALSLRRRGPSEAQLDA